MTDRPILFRAPMIRALLDGRKTQTRRLLKPQPPEAFDFFGFMDDEHKPGRKWALWLDDAGDDARAPIPYAPGDLLWVKETWRLPKRLDAMSPSQCAAACLEAGYKRPWAPIDYAANGACINWSAQDGGYGRDRSSIHMPRWASRLTLTVTDVRVQRLQDITEADAWAEGCKRGEPWDNGKGFFPAEEPHQSGKCWIGWDDAQDWFADLWDDIHGSGAWYENPWIVALTFGVHRRNIDSMEAAA